MPTIRTICVNAATEFGLCGEGHQALSSYEATLLLGKLRRILNNWNADQRAVYAPAFLSFTLTPSLSPHTIGPTGATWTVTSRPVTLDAANLVIPNTGNPSSNLELNLRDKQWWASQSVPTLSSTYPTDVYYQPDWPNGKLYFWPVPEAAYVVELMVRVVLDDTVTLDDDFSLPPGYEDAITLTLAEGSASLFGMVCEPSMVNAAREARNRVFANNDPTPSLRTADGQAVGNGSASTFNYLTGQVN